MKRNTVLVSGCTKGIGLAITRLFAEKGFHVAGCARDEKSLMKLFTDLSTRYPQQQFLMESCDVSDKHALLNFADDALNEFSGIDVLINNAGVFLPGSILKEEDGTFEKLMNTNLASAYHLSRKIIPAMVNKKKGHVFNICSTASITPYVNGGSYCISKYAMLGMNGVLREELKGSGVKVTAVLPGATHTNSWKGSNLPKSRFIPADDIAKLIWNAWELSPSTNVEEILVRPIAGDIN